MPQVRFVCNMQHAAICSKAEILDLDQSDQTDEKEPVNSTAEVPCDAKACFPCELALNAE